MTTSLSVNREASWFQADSLSCRAFALSLLIVAVHSFITAIAPVTGFGYDELYMLDGIWRVVQGQHAGIDFYNPLGFGLFYVGAGFWHLFGAHRWILVATSAAFNLVIVACAANIVSRRLAFSPRYALLVCAVIAFEGSAPSVYGWPFALLGMAAFYARLSVAALAVLFVQFFAKPADRSERADYWEILPCALLLNVLFVVKISAFAVGLMLVGGAVVIGTGPFSRRHLYAAGLLIAALTIAEFVLTGVTPTALLHDYKIAAGARVGFATSTWEGLMRVAGNWATFLFGPLLAVYAFSKPAANLAKGKIAAIIGIFMTAQIILNLSNYQPATLFLAPVCAAALLAWKRPVSRPQKLWRLDESLPLVTMLFFLASQAASSFLGLGLWLTASTGFASPVLVSGDSGVTLAALHVVGEREYTTGYALAANSGIGLLKSAGLANETIASLDYENPFPLLLGSPSPRGTPIVWSIGAMEPRVRQLPADQLVGDACVVMVPLHPISIETDPELIIDSAAPVLARAFNLVAQNDDWMVYRRNTGCTGPEPAK